ncbi:MAG: cytochrome c oxidase subunit II [Alphaproteobacteria bacterium]
MFTLWCGQVFAGGDVVGEPVPKGMGLQIDASLTKEHLHHFHNLLLYIISGITLFVFLLLVYVCVRFRASKNPVPSKTTHNLPLEIVWTLVPVLILVVIAVPSFRLMYYMDKAPNAQMTLKVTGHQWYWEYTYPDQGDINFSSNIVPAEEIKAEKGQKRLLSTDKWVVLPVDTDVRILTTSADVIHGFAIPSFGLKKDAVPGRLNETWTHVKEEGTYYGQCTVICGTNHGFMPMEIKVVSKEVFAEWSEKAKKDVDAAQIWLAGKIAEQQHASAVEDSAPQPLPVSSETAR